MKTMTCRVENFTDKERSSLMEIAREFKIVDSKAYDATTLDRKKSAWEEIARKFNVCNPLKSTCDVKTLKGLWRRTKFRARVAAAEESRKNSETSGGGPPIPADKEMDTFVVDFLRDSCDPVDNACDNDSANIPVITEEDICPEQSPIEVERVEDDQFMVSEILESTSKHSKRKKRMNGLSDEVEEFLKDMAKRNKRLHEMQMEVQCKKRKAADILIEGAEYKRKRSLLRLWEMEKRLGNSIGFPVGYEKSFNKS